MSVSHYNSDGLHLEGDRLELLDYSAIAGYFIIILAIGLWSSKKSQSDSINSYFLAGRTMHWIPVGASLFASNVGSGHFIGLAGSGAKSGVAVASFELSAIFILLLLGWFFIPVYTSAQVYTMPEYLRKRFGGQRIRVYLSILSLILYIFTKISADLFAGALFIKQSMNLSMYLSVTILLAISALFAIAGGLTAVIWTDAIQTLLMILGAIVLMVFSLIKVGGYFLLMDKFANAVPNDSSFEARDNKTNESCSKVTEYYNHMFRPIDDEEMPWFGLIFGMWISSVWYWCSDQVIVQRALSARNVSHAKAGCILAALIKFTPLYLLVIPGMAARVLWPNEVACSSPAKCQEICGSAAGCTNIAYPLLVLNVMPTGATGLMLSVMMAALMSSLTSIFNSASTIFTIDIWSRIRKRPSEVEQVIVGRIFIALLVAVSIFWIPFIEGSQDSQLFHYIQSVSNYLAPPVCAVYLLAIFWARCNEQGAFWGLMVGLLVGVARFVLDFSFKAPLCGSNDIDPRPAILSKVHYLHFGIILFVISLLVIVVISLLTEPIKEDKLYRLTFWTRFSREVRHDIDSKDSVDDGIYNMAFKETENGPAVEFAHVVMEEQPKRTKEQLRRDENGNAEIKDKKSEKNKWNDLVQWFCCMRNNEEVPKIKQTTEVVMSKEEEANQAAVSAQEDWKQAAWCNFGAVLLLVIGGFFYGLYA